LTGINPVIAGAAAAFASPIVEPLFAKSVAAEVIISGAVVRKDTLASPARHIMGRFPRGPMSG
jgi:hypothetical protein